MDAKTGFFYLFSIVLLFAAFRVITARNPVHAVLFLMLAFSQASGVWLLLRAEFLVDAKGLNKIQGMPFTSEEIRAAALNLLTK